MSAPDKHDCTHKNVTGGFDQESGIFWIFSHFVFMSSDSPKRGNSNNWTGSTRYSLLKLRRKTPPSLPSEPQVVTILVSCFLLLPWIINPQDLQNKMVQKWSQSRTPEVKDGSRRQSKKKLIETCAPLVFFIMWIVCRQDNCFAKQSKASSYLVTVIEFKLID